MNREEWLTKLADELRPVFRDIGAQVPDKIRFACGWPSARAFSKRNRVVGECWGKSASKDGTIEICVSPAIAQSDEVAAILAHELVHACGAKGHRGEFRKIAVKLGLEGPMRATVAGSALKNRLNRLIGPLGEYPHAPLDKSMSPIKREGTRLIKVECGACGYVVRTTQKWIATGLPQCPCGEGMEVVR